MGFQKMVEHMQERQNVRLVLALLSLADVIHDHVSDFLHAVLFLRKVLSERGSGDFRQMLMLRDYENCSSVRPDNATQSSNRNGWIAPACLAHSFDHLVGAQQE